MTKDEMRIWIDNASYEKLLGHWLGHWRSASVGDPFFVGEIGDYYKKKMAEKRNEVGDAEHVRASKSIRWEK